MSYNEIVKESLSNKLMQMNVAEFVNCAKVDSVDQENFFGIVRKYKYYSDNLDCYITYENASDDMLLKMRLSTFETLMKLGLEMPMKNYAGEPLSEEDTQYWKTKFLADWESLKNLAVDVMSKAIPEPLDFEREGLNWSMLFS